MAGLVPATPLNKARHRHTCGFLGSALVIGVAGTGPAMTHKEQPLCRPKRKRDAGEPYTTPSFFCRLVEEVVYWNTRRLSG
jgi:hypothetical protein